MGPLRAVFLILIVLVATSSTQAQVVREEGVKSVAGILGGAYATEALWTVKSGGSEVIFASLDAEIYRTGAHHEEESEPSATADEGNGGCGDEGGPGRFCLQVIDSSGTVICQATRPAPPPGWQRDPRLACALPEISGQATYTIRVSLTGPEGSCTLPSLPISSPTEHPFLLNVSVRRVARSGVSIQEAVAQSGNRFR